MQLLVMRTPEQLRADSRRLRREQTPAEGLLWRNLRAKRLNGAKFRRQHPIGDHIVDFCCIGYRLVVEVDGEQHADADAEAKDAARTARLEAHGFKVIRFWNDEVLGNLDGVLTSIASALKENGFQEGDEDEEAAAESRS
jgi:very-short-patch-repair endonuclease